MTTFIDECQMNKELVIIKNSKPFYSCLNCQNCKSKDFYFSLQDNNIRTSMKCYSDNKVFDFCINDFYKKKDNISIITPIHKNENKTLFASTDELYDFVLSKLTKNIAYKNRIISRINKTCYFNPEDKIKFINKIEKGFNQNFKLNLECYKILHFLLFNYLNKGFSFPFNDYINKSYQYNEMFDLVENSVYQLLSFYKYQYLLKFQYKHNYSYENSFEVDFPINFELSLFNENLIGKDFNSLVLVSINLNKNTKQKKIQIEKTFNYYECKKCIQLNSEIILDFTSEKVCLLNSEHFVPIKVIDLPEQMSNFTKISSGKIVAFEPGERKIIIFKFEEKYTIKIDIILEVGVIFDYGVCEYQENKIIFHDNQRIYLYDCEHFQYEVIFDDFGDLCNCKCCLLPNNKYAFSIFEQKQIQIFDLKNPKQISQKILPPKPHLCDIREGIISVNDDLIFLIYGKGKFIFSQSKEVYVQKIEEGTRHFVDNLTLLGDGRILVGYTRYMKLYSINEDAKIEKIGYNSEAEKQLKRIKNREKEGNTIYEENEMEPPVKDGFFIRSFLNSEIIIVTMDNKTKFFF